MNSILRLCSICLLLLHAAPVEAASTTELERLKPFLDPYTVGIVELNLDDLDVTATANDLRELLPEARERDWAESIDQARQILESWLQEFRQAGGQRLYVVLSLSWLRWEPPMVVVAPLTGSANADRLKATLAMAHPAWQPEVMHGCVATAPEFILRRLRSGPAPGDFERWQIPFETAEPGLVRLVLLPYAESDRVLAELLPTLPPMLGGGPGSIVTRGFRWATVSLQLPPAGALSLSIQSDSTESAVALGEVIKNGLAATGQDPVWAELAALLHPVAAGDQLKRRLELTALDGLIPALQAPLEEAQAKANQIKIVNQLKHIGLALHIHATDHANRFPPHLVDILKSLGDIRLLLHPANSQSLPSDLATQPREAQMTWIDQHSPFVFVLAGASLKEIRSPQDAVLVYERPQPGDGSRVGVLFADGSVQRVAPERLKQLLGP